LVSSPGYGELLRAPIFHTPRNPFLETGGLQTFEDGALVIIAGRIAAMGDYTAIRAQHPRAAVSDLRGGFLLPGLVDTHTHFPQLRALGGLGEDLLGWLDRFALPEECRMQDVAYAEDTARRFVAALMEHGTTTALAFGAHFAPATAALFEASAAAGLRLVSGMVLSDRELRPDLHQTPERAYAESTELIRRFHGKMHTSYAVTPRFALSASEAMLEVCQSLLRENDGLYFQSHINESKPEIAAVARMFPWAADYLAVYERFGLTGSRSVLAHNVHPKPQELERLASTSISIAHCPCSNAALGSGIFPFQRHIEAGVRCALGTDVGGGTGFGILKEGLQAYLVQRLAPDGPRLTPAELLYLATKAGAEALMLQEEIGDLQPGKSADLIFLKPCRNVLASVVERADSMDRILAAIFTLGDAASIREVRIGGRIVFSHCHDR
jgi:guanine deaminase